MPSYRERTDATLTTDPGLLAEISATWPPRVPDDGRGYRARPVDEAEPVAVLGLPGERHYALVVARRNEYHAALPLVHADDGWQLAAAGDGMAAALVGAANDVEDGGAAAGAFGLERDLAFEMPDTSERALTADQSNHSLVVGERVLVKWRTAFDADGRRSTLLRRHLREARYEGVPPLLATLDWRDDTGGVTSLADLDAFLPDAVDGWDLAIASMVSALDRGQPARMRIEEIAPTLGRMTAGLHVALATPSTCIEAPCATVDHEIIEAWRAAAYAGVDSACAIDAPDQASLTDRRESLLADIDLLSTVPTTQVQPTHGDLHIGQLVGWAGGIAFIDLDGPPGRRSRGLELEPTARDVAQMLVALANLAAAVDKRTAGRHRQTLRAWASQAHDDYIAAYQAAAMASGSMDLLDTRLLRPFVAEQLCRELIYAAEVLPRWRYAPMAALDWRYRRDTA